MTTTVPARSSVLTPGRVLVISDPQYATSNDQSIFVDQITWAIAQAPDLVLFAGDLVDDNVTGLYLPNWPAIQAGVARLDAAGVRWAVVPGNHDYLPILTRTTVINSYIPLPAWMTPKDAGRVENAWGLVTLAGRQWLLICLEWVPRDAVVAWAAGVIDAHAALPVLLLTHCWLNWDGTRATAVQAIGSTLNTTPAEGINSGAELWSGLVEGRSNVRLVLCGHVEPGFVGAAIVRQRVDIRGDGTRCQQIECNYQYSAPYGAGLLSDLRFDEENGQLVYDTYSPYLGARRGAADGRFVAVMP